MSSGRGEFGSVKTLNAGYTGTRIALAIHEYTNEFNHEPGVNCAFELSVVHRWVSIVLSFRLATLLP